MGNHRAAIGITAHLYARKKATSAITSKAVRNVARFIRAMSGVEESNRASAKSAADNTSGSFDRCRTR